MEQFFKDKSILKNVLILLLFVAISFIIYFPILKADPLWDDWVFIFNSWTLRNVETWQYWGWGDHRRAWPMFYTVISLMYKTWGAKVVYYHVANVLLHSLNGCLLYRTLKKLNGNYALLWALIYLVHPLNFFTVSWIVQIKTLLCIFFFLISLNLFLENRESGKTYQYVLSVLTFALSVFSKAAFAPVLLLMVFYKEKKKILPYLLIGIYSVMLTTWSTHIKRYISDIKVSSYFVSEAMAENSAQKKPIVARKISPPKSKDVPLMSDVVLSLNNFEKYILFIVFPLKNLLVHDETIISFSYGEMVSGIFIVVALCFIFSWLWKKRDLVSIAGVSFFIISLVPLCGIFFIPIFHFSSFTEYWLCVPVLGALVFLSKNIPKFKFSGLILVIILLSYAGKTIMSAYENSNPILVIQNSIDHSPNNPLVPLILAKHYYFIGEYGKSNEILLKAKKNTSLESGKLDRDIEENLRQMNGEKSEKFTL